MFNSTAALPVVFHGRAEVRGFYLTLVLALGVAGPALGEGPSDDASLELHFKQAEVATVVEAVAVATGTAFVFDERLRGRVTITVPRRVSVDEALEILNAALRMEGFVALPGPSGIRRIVPTQDAPSRSIEREDDPQAHRERSITTLVQLRKASADSVASTLQPLVGSDAVLRVFKPSNSLILSSSEARVHRLLGIVRALDQAPETTVNVFRLRHRNARDLAETVKRVHGDGHEVSAIADARTNAVIVEAPPATVEEIRNLLRRLDRPVEGGGTLRVLRIWNVDPEQLAETLGGVGSEAGPLNGPASVTTLRSEDYEIVVDRATRSLLVRSDPSAFKRLTELIAELDVRPPMVSVEAHLMEITTDESLRLAIDARLTTGSDDGELRVETNTSGRQALDNPIADGLLARVARDFVPVFAPGPDGDPIVVGKAPNDALALIAAQRNTETRTLMRPHLLVASGEEHEISVGDNIPILVQRTTEGADPLTLQTNVERQDIGVMLRVRPTVGQRGVVRLEVRIEQTALAPSVVGNVDQVGPTLRKREIESTALLDDGEFLVIGADRLPALEIVENGVPYLKDLPVLGWLFKSSSERARDRYLVIAIQVRIVRTRDELTAETIRLRRAMERHLSELADLANGSNAPYALLVGFFPDRAQAEGMATRLEQQGHEAVVAPWEWHGSLGFDVYVTGLPDLIEATALSSELLSQGLRGEVVAVPSRQ
jgi:general secretion pathway protein D